MRRFVISFDLDGTLVDYTFVNAVWFEAIPTLYAESRQISFEEALRAVRSEYDKIGDEQIEWYDLQYWLARFHLDYEPTRILGQVRRRVRVYEEVPEVLQRIATEHILVINSNCPREFMEIELQEGGIRGYFRHTFSSTSDFQQIKKTRTYYERICKIISVKPSSLVHVGDNWKFDYLVPSEVGIKAVYLDRSSLKVGDDIIYNLTQLEELLKRYS